VKVATGKHEDIILLWETLGEKSLGILRNKLENKIKMDLRRYIVS
jgi:hypothetical protein